ncbi:MAG TPA: hypothetical protein VGJ20_22825 [Xanthobacteraceae bacterium]
MALDRAWLPVVTIVALTVCVPLLARAGGVSFSDDDSSGQDEGAGYFGFVREVDGPGLADAKVTAALKNGSALVTRTDIMGVYKIPGFGKDINPDDVTISCAKDGYKQASVLRRPHANGDSKEPIEVECYLQKN